MRAYGNEKQPFAIPTVCKMQNRIDPTPDYQRPPAWSRKQKQLLEKRFFEACPSIEQTDPRRGFSHEQRLAIYRRDGGQCRLAIKCDGVKVGWDNWQADHIIAHSKGGKTTVANRQLACVDCNLSKGAAS